MLNVLASVVMMIVCVVVMVTPFVSHELGMHFPAMGSGVVLGAAFGGFFLALLLLVSPSWVELNAPDYKPRFFRIYQQRGLFVCLPAMIFLITMVTFKLIALAIEVDEGIYESFVFQDHWRWLF